PAGPSSQASGVHAPHRLLSGWLKPLKDQGETRYDRGRHRHLSSNRATRGYIMIDPAVVQADVARALAEDVGSGDLTAELIPADKRSRARVISREAAIICGRQWFDEVFRQLDA